MSIAAVRRVRFEAFHLKSILAFLCGTVGLFTVTGLADLAAVIADSGGRSVGVVEDDSGQDRDENPKSHLCPEAHRTHVDLAQLQ